MKKNIIKKTATKMTVEVVKECLNKKGIYELEKAESGADWIWPTENKALNRRFTQSLLRNPVFIRILSQE